MDDNTQRRPASAVALVLYCAVVAAIGFWLVAWSIDRTISAAEQIMTLRTKE